MRVVALSNEGSPGADPDIPWALERLHVRGLVASYQVYSTPTRAAVIGSTAAASEIATLVRELDADVLAFFHTGSCLFNAGDLERIRASNTRTVWIYHEGDPFRRWTLPYPRTAIHAVRRCRGAFLVCGGYLADLVRRANGGFVTYAPSWVNTDRFPHTWGGSVSFRHDVAFVGSNIRSRRRPIPGARERARLVAMLQERYGARFAVYGRGWKGVGAMGPCSLDDVGEIYAQSRVCVGIDHAVGPYQFSNRLPIALACGIPLVHSPVAASAEILPAMEPWQFFDGPAGALNAIDRLLNMDTEALEAMSDTARSLAVALSCERVMEYMLHCARLIRDREDPRDLDNPWLAGADRRL